MRLAGSANHKTGQLARIIEADFALAAYPVDELVGDLPDPAPARRWAAGAGGRARDPYKRIAPAEYSEQLAGIARPARAGSCAAPRPGTPTVTRARTGRARRDAGLALLRVRRRGAIYDFASALLGGPLAASCAATRSVAPASYVRRRLRTAPEEKDP